MKYVPFLLISLLTLMLTGVLATSSVGKPSQSALPPSPQTVPEALKLAEKTLIYVEKSRKVPEFAAELKKLSKKAKLSGNSPQLLQAIKQLRRKILFAHPALDFKKLLINKTPPTKYSHNCDQYLARHSSPGKLVVLTDWKTANPKEAVLFEGKMPVGSYNKPKLHWNGKKIVFAFAKHSEGVESKERRFFIWEAALDGSSLRQLTGTKADRFNRWGGRYTSVIEDNDPSYLPDGGIAFVSTRCQGFGRCHNGRYTPSLLLYRWDKDYGVSQLSWGEANECDPTVLNDGRIVYTRWEYINRDVTKFHMLWWTRPDGTASNNFYGNATERPWMLSSMSTIPGSQKVLALATGHHTYSTGAMVLIDPTQGDDYEEPITRITPEIQWFEAEEIVNAGCYSTPYALNEDLYLASYSPQKIPKQGQQGKNDYAIYLVDSFGGRELIYRDEKVSSFSPTPLIKKSMPPVLPENVPLAARLGSSDRNGDTQPAAPKPAVLTLQDVYLTRNDPDGVLKRGEIKSLRINAILNQPAVTKGGGAQPSLVRHDTPKKILGTVPVYADGSAKFEVPSCRALQLQALDKDGIAVLTMRSFIYLQPGEQRSCVGCHETPGTPPVLRQTAAMTKDVTPIIPTSAIETDPYEGFSYPRMVQPVWDRYCISCHGLSGDAKTPDGKRKDGGLSLLGTVEPSVLPKGLMYSDPGRVPHSYNALMGRHKNLLKIARFKAETNSSRPRDYFAAESKLREMLEKGHGKVTLDPDSSLRVMEWLDLNCQCYGNFSWNRQEARHISQEGEKQLRAYLKELFGEKIALQPIAALLNVGQPSASRALLAPLPTKEGGWEEKGWKPLLSRDDPRWKKILTLIEASINPLLAADKVGTCGRRNCRCRSCWVRQSEEAFQKTLEK